MRDTRAESWPHPVAHAYRQFIVASESRERLDEACRFLESTITFLGTFAVGWCAVRRREKETFHKWVRSLAGKGPALGMYVDVIRDSGLCDRTWLDPLNDFVSFRNNLAHGGRPRRRSDLIARTTEASSFAERVAETPGLIAELDLYQVQRSRVLDDGSFEIELREMCGTSSRFPVSHGRSSGALKEGAILCARSTTPSTGTCDLQDAIDLSAWIIHGICDECGDDELFYITRRTATLERYKSFENSHSLSRPIGVDAPPPPRPRATTTPTTTPERTVPSPTAAQRRLPLAGPLPRRFGAWLVDLTLAGTLLAVICLGLLSIGMEAWLAALISTVPLLTYGALRPSPGKRLCDLEVICVDTGVPPGTVRGVLRFGLLVFQMVFVYPFWVSVYWLRKDPARQGWHDRSVRTVVVRRSELHRQLAAGGESAAAKKQFSRRSVPP